MKTGKLLLSCTAYLLFLILAIPTQAQTPIECTITSEIVTSGNCAEGTVNVSCTDGLSCSYPIGSCEGVEVDITWVVGGCAYV